MADSFKNNREFVFVILTMLVIIARDVLQVPIPSFLLVGLITCSMIILPYEKNIPFLFFLLPLSCGIPGYTFLVAYVILVLKGPSLSPSQIIPIIVIILLELENELVGADRSTVVASISFISFMAIFFYFISKTDIVFDKGKALLFFCIGTVFCFSVIYYCMFSQYSVIDILSGRLRSGALGIVDNDVEQMEGHLAMNANTLAYFSICAFSCLFVSFNQLKIGKWLLWGLQALILVSGLLTFSRTYILTLALFFVAILFTTDIKHKIKYIVIGSVIAICVIIVFQQYIIEMFGSFLERGHDENIVTAGGRIGLFTFYNNAWSKDLEYILFGAGTINHIKVLQGYNAIHNGLQQIWVSLGIIGLMTFIIPAARYLKQYYKSYSKYLIIPFFVTLVFDQSIQSINPYPLVFPLMISLLTLQMDES